MPTAISSCGRAGGDQETLRFTVTGGNCNENCYLLVPAVPVITPNSPNVYQGNAATLSVAPYGSNAPTIQWQTDNGTAGATWTSITDATNATYAVVANSLSVKPYEYQVILTTASNGTPVNVTTAPLTVNILAPTVPVVVQDTYPASAAGLDRHQQQLRRFLHRPPTDHLSVDGRARIWG